MASGIVFNINSKIATLFINRVTTLHIYDVIIVVAPPGAGKDKLLSC
jgi:hypothetical protein